MELLFVTNSKKKNKVGYVGGCSLKSAEYMFKEQHLVYTCLVELLVKNVTG